MSTGASILSSILLKRQNDAGDSDGDDMDNDPARAEIFSSWALLILILLLIGSLWTSYYLQQRRIQAIHETVVSIFGGMVVGLTIRVLPGHYIQDTVSFKYSYFFNLLLPPIILNSGYELHQANFFANIGTILTFAFAGTFLSTVFLGILLYIWTFIGLEGLDISLVESLSVGATLSATDPVTILAIFNTYKVDPQLYTIIFGESILNDAVAIVMFETAQKFHGQTPHFSSFFKGVGMFLITFTVSLCIGCVIGIMTALVLKHSLIRRYPQIESCLIILVAYAAYFFSNGCHMSGIVSLLFCGICLKHYAYYNMSRRTQITVKYIFKVLAQLSENFIFIYLGLSLFTEVELIYKPLFIIVTALGVCISRWAAVVPLSRLINLVHRARAKARGQTVIADIIPPSYQMMLFWAGLRGAVGVALAAGLEGKDANSLRATILVVVVLTVIIFGGTTARMLEILGIRTGVVDQEESDDEFDIEAPANGGYQISSNPNGDRSFSHGVDAGPYNLGTGIPLSPTLDSSSKGDIQDISTPQVNLHEFVGRTTSRASMRDADRRRVSGASINLDIGAGNTVTASTTPNAFPEVAEPEDDRLDDDEDDVADLPPMSTTLLRTPPRNTMTDMGGSFGSPKGVQGIETTATTLVDDEAGRHSIFTRSAAEHAKWFRNFDETVLKPVLLDNLHRSPSSDAKDRDHQDDKSPHV